MDLFVLRHGEAGQRSSSGIRDYERSLTTNGQKEVAAIAKSLKYLGIKFDFIITSPLKRAHQTAVIVAKTFKMEKRMKDWDELKPEGNHVELYRKLLSSPPFKQQSSILVVGHEPHLSEMISQIIAGGNNSNSGSSSSSGGGGGGHIVLKKAGLAKIRVTSSSPNIHGELRWLLTPGLLKKMKKSISTRTSK